MWARHIRSILSVFIVTWRCCEMGALHGLNVSQVLFLHFAATSALPSEVLRKGNAWRSGLGTSTGQMGRCTLTIADPPEADPHPNRNLIPCSTLTQ